MNPPDSKLDIRDTPTGAEFAVKVVPGASRTRIAGVLGGALKVAVAAPPEAGKANAALIALLADTLDIPKSDITIVAGHAQARKRVAVAGLTVTELGDRLRAQLP